MKLKLYLFTTNESQTCPFVKLEDYQSLAKEAEHLRVYCNELVALDNLPCLPKDLENLREANTHFQVENEKLRDQLYKAGVCFDCEREVNHFVDEPFSSCACGTGEDCSGPSTIQKLRMDNKKLLELSGGLNEENKSLLIDLENLNLRLNYSRAAKDKFAEDWKKWQAENKDLKEERDLISEKYDNDKIGWEKKWECAVELAAIAENKLYAERQKLTDDVLYWQQLYKTRPYSSFKF